MNAATLSTEEAIEKSKKLLMSLQVLYLGTNRSNGFPNIRAFSIGNAESLSTIWFSTSVKSEKIKEIRLNPKVVLYGYDQHSMAELRLFGRIEMLSDIDSRKKIWKEEYLKYWPDGIHSPDLTVLKFSAEFGIYSEMQSRGEFRI